MRDTTNRILDDLAKLATDAAGMAQGVRREAESVLRSGLEKILREMDIVNREEFEAARDMAVLARQENEALKTRIAALEARLGATTPPAPMMPDTGPR